jgi:biopolymer transport protein ExbB/TolQ
MDISELYMHLGNSIYAAQAAAALWGLFCALVVMMRVKQSRFKSEDVQNEFLAEMESVLASGDFGRAEEMAKEDPRAVPQLAAMAISNRDLGITKTRQLVADHFRRDLLADLDYRVSWVQTVIKIAPMLGLLGTVLGMMSAFGKLAATTKVDPTQLADDISLALITTAVGLSIAIPLMTMVASINVKMRKMEDLVAVGLARFFETFRASLSERASAA